jgi:tryptophan 2,3-dioxygenase
MTEKALTYTSYLRIDDLLQLQEPRSDGPEHDEMLFIVIHQVYELWFRQLLHEAAFLQRTLHAADAAQALATVERTLTILKTVVAQLDVLETMTPLSFASFRHRLESASGFQSAQFREWEAVLGRRDRSVLDHHPAGPARERI